MGTLNTVRLRSISPFGSSLCLGCSMDNFSSTGVSQVGPKCQFLDRGGKGQCPTGGCAQAECICKADCQPSLGSNQYFLDKKL